MSSHAFATEGLDRCPFMPVFGAPQVMFERGSGTELWDTAGNRYLDFLCGLAVTSLGHANPVIAAAVAEQASTLLHVSNLFANRVATDAAVASLLAHTASNFARAESMVAPAMAVPPVLEDVLLLYHWYVSPAPVAVTLMEENVPPTHCVCAAVDCAVMVAVGVTRKIPDTALVWLGPQDVDTTQ